MVIAFAYPAQSGDGNARDRQKKCASQRSIAGESRTCDLPSGE
jgi:hypothetical protein